MNDPIIEIVANVKYELEKAIVNVSTTKGELLFEDGTSDNFNFEIDLNKIPVFDKSQNISSIIKSKIQMNAVTRSKTEQFYFNYDVATKIVEPPLPGITEVKPKNLKKRKSVK